ncbi:TonB-dependent receptor domain-containing protein [Balneola sp. MJW-20]|uniref:TonB-dependent receptor domain-containing protein n=1 Tax=Gracilimonas aurantiaca TaxID=3234185 RepID=UPI00390993FF
MTLLLIVPLAASAQYRLEGTILDESTGQPIVSAEIYDNEAGKSFRTNKQGKFVIENLPADDYLLYIYKLGYRIITLPLEVRSDTSITIQMEALSETLTEVAVIDQRDEFYGLKRLREVEGTAIYAGKKTEVISLSNKIANIAANNPRQIYAQVSGLNIYESNDAGLQLNIGGRGLDPSRSSNFNVRQNGYDISADVLGYPESYYTPPAEALSEIQIVRGAASLQYGTQFGGLVNFRMKKPVRDKTAEFRSRQSTGSNNLFTSFNSLSGTVGKLGYYGYYHYKTGDGFRPNSGFESDNIYLYTDLELGEKTTIYADFTYLDYLAQQPGGLTDVQFYRNPDFSNRSRNWFRVDWKLASAGLEHRFNYKKRLTFKIFGLDASREALGFRTNRVSQTDDLSAPRDLIIGTFRNFGSEVRYLQRYTLGNRNAVFLIGAKYYQSENTSVQGPGTNSSDADFFLATDQYPDYPNQSDFIFPNRNLALFGEHIFYLQDNLSITPGFRFEYIRTESKGNFQRVNFDLAGNPIQNDTFDDNRVFDRNFLLLGTGISYLPSPEVEIYGNLSSNYRSVTFNDIRIVNPTFQVDPDIRDESGYTADLGIRGRIGETLSYDINGFGLWYNDRLGEVLRPETRINAEGVVEETGRIVRFRGNIGTAFMYGLESLAEWNILQSVGIRNKDLKLSTFVNVALTRSEYLKSEIPGVESNEVEFTPLVNLKSGVNFGYRNLLLSLQYTYVSVQFTDASNAEQNINDNQSGIRGEIPAYDVMDLSLSWSYGIFRMETGINNVLNKNYFTRRATGYPGPGIIPSQPRTWYFTLQMNIGK